MIHTKFRVVVYLLFFPLFITSCIYSVTPKSTVFYVKGFPENLEQASKSTYAGANVELLGGMWYFEDALIGSTANDVKAGLKAVRIKENGFIRMNYDIVGVKEVRLSSATYQGDNSSTWELLASRNSGESWTKLGNTIITTAQLSNQSFAVNETGKIRFMIQKTAGGSNRINIDDLVITAISQNQINTTLPSRDDNLALGNPSNASSKDDNNYLMIKNQYTLSYNRSRATANWVSWHLSTAWKGTAARTNNFRADTSLPAGWDKVISSDYTSSGFDRGHLCPSDDRDASIEDNDETFLMTNIAPQAPNNNRNAWEQLESYARSVAAAGNELYIVAGVAGKGGKGSDGQKITTLQNGKITVPASFWKVIVILPIGIDDISRIEEQTRVIAINIPNNDNVENSKWGDYRISIDDLEELTGYDFLSNVPESIQTQLERRKDVGPTIKVSNLRN